VYVDPGHSGFYVQPRALFDLMSPARRLSAGGTAFSSRSVYFVYFHVYYVYMTRERIFSAAKVVLEREGVSGLTIRKVAARAKLSPMAMYRHFADKDALLNALVEDGLTAWENRVRALRAEDPMEWVDELSEAFLDFALSQPHLFDAAFFLPAPNARQYPDDFVAGRSPVIAMLMVRLDQARAAGRLGEKPSLEIALAMSALAQGLISMQRANRFSSEKQFKTLFHTALHHCIESFSTTHPGETR
jgi:AcrR family transcriptional regulator